MKKARNSLAVEPLIDLSAVDMTLILAADSFMRRRLPGCQNVPADPEGGKCLSDFIDLLVNSDACFLMLPTIEDYSTPLVFARQIPGLKRLRNCATVQLNKTTEKRVIREFQRLLSDHDWLSQWFKSHWGNPTTPRNQYPALGKLARRFATISDEGWSMLMQHFTKSELARLPPLAPSMPEEPYLKHDVNRAGGYVAYQYAYAFDAFRRGWQYAASSNLKQRQIWYYPHRLRQKALGNDAQGWIESKRDKFWSWGRCVVAAIDSSPGGIEPERVADWINGLSESNAPRWLELSDVIASGIDNRESRLAVRDLIEMLEVVARSAGIPRSLLTLPPLPMKLGRFAFEQIMERCHLTTAMGVLHILPSSKAMELVSYNASEWAKDAANFFCKGAFGYPGLVSSHLGQRAAKPRRPIYIL
jgi:hypothetical protein